MADAVDAPVAGAVVDEPPPRRRRWIRAASLPGAWVALLFAALSFTPSLLPRSGLFQGAVAGVTAAIGYAFGVFGAWVWREVADREARPRSEEHTSELQSRQYFV